MCFIQIRLLCLNRELRLWQEMAYALYTRGADQWGVKIKCHDWRTLLSKMLSFRYSNMLIPQEITLSYSLNETRLDPTYLQFSTHSSYFVFSRHSSSPLDPTNPKALLSSPTRQAKTLIAITFSSHPGTAPRNSSTASKCHCSKRILSP